MLLITFLSLVLGELAPKTLALRNPEALAARVAPFFQVLSRVASPVVWLLETTALDRRDSRTTQEKITEEDVRALVRQAAENGSLEKGETQRIDHVLRFNDRRVRELMTPRTEVVTLVVLSPLGELVEQVLARPHDR